MLIINNDYASIPPQVTMKSIRNFCIIAHIDHGKSTLADRILEMTDVIHTKDNQQVLDSMDLERERGITIKAKPIRIPFKSSDGKDYIFNLIDTPGHVDFNYEVSRSLYACEAAILLVDSSQGVEAQTVANAYMAIDAGLEIIPVLNKIDLPHSMVDESKLQIEDMLGISSDGAMEISAKHGTGINELLESIPILVPPPKGNENDPLKCLIFDSHYDTYRGVICYIRVFSGELKSGDVIQIKSTGKKFEVEEVGYFRMKAERTDTLHAGEVGYVSAVIRDSNDIHVGDTIISAEHPDSPAVPGFKRMKPMVFCGIYPINTNDYDKLQKSINKLELNDSSITFEKESSAALGHGFRVGFLGMLHMEIFLERLRREFEQELIATMPSVAYEINKTNGDVISIENPSLFPSPQEINSIKEPIVRTQIMVPSEYVGQCMELANSKRGTLIEMVYPDTKRTTLVYDLPLAEMIIEFYDKLKTVSRGYASLDYNFKSFEKGDLVKVDILVNGDQVDALSYISERDSAVPKARKLVHRLLKLIPRQQFKIPLQGAINGKIIAREDIAPVRKDVLAKCYGGDVTRKKKLLEKQKKGKKRMKMVGSVEVPQEAFLSLLSINDDGKNNK